MTHHSPCFGTGSSIQSQGGNKESRRKDTYGGYIFPSIYMCRDEQILWLCLFTQCYDPLPLLLMCFKLSVEFRTNRLACLCFLQEKFEDIKEVISSHISMGYRQYNGQEKTYKRSNNNVQNRKLKIEQHKSH
jgi:hypothetical protein